MDTDVVIVGGGPAGLSAALTLAQAFRDIVVVDEYRPAGRRVRGHITRDGVELDEYLTLARAEASAAGALVRRGLVVAVQETADAETGFHVTIAPDRFLRCRRVLLATGVDHRLPNIPGLAGLWGSLVHNCPYCHHWGPRPAACALVIGSDPAAVRIAALLTQWAREVVLIPGGPVLGPLPGGVRVLERQAVEVRPLGTNGLEVVLDDGETATGEVCFVDPPTLPRWHGLTDAPVESVGSSLDPTGRSAVAGLWVVGTAASPHQRVIMAAAHGATAAQAVNASLTAEDLGGTVARSWPARSGEVAR